MPDDLTEGSIIRRKMKLKPLCKRVLIVTPRNFIFSPSSRPSY